MTEKDKDEGNEITSRKEGGTNCMKLGEHERPVQSLNNSLSCVYMFKHTVTFSVILQLRKNPLSYFLRQLVYKRSGFWSYLKKTSKDVFSRI